MKTTTAAPIPEERASTDGTFLYEARLNHTKIIEFGYSIEEASRPGASLPLEGARFDLHVAGTIDGPRFSGSFEAVDYGELRADGRFALDLHGVITTDDGETISLSADGIFRPENGDVFENVQLKSSSPTYAWVNRLHIWARGTADVEKREVYIRAYAL